MVVIHVAESKRDRWLPRLQLSLETVEDGGPKIISFIIDGVLLDGGDVRQFGWARFPAQLRTVSFGQSLKTAWELDGEMRGFRLHNRVLRTTEDI